MLLLCVKLGEIWQVKIFNEICWSTFGPETVYTYSVSKKKLQPYVFDSKIAKSQPIYTKCAENNAK